jgi:tRNA (guanosine-2'-O-)-methyltransferase
MSASWKNQLEAYLAEFVTDHKKALFERVLAHRTRYVEMYLEDIDSPQDASATLRSAECYGIQNITIFNRNLTLPLSKGVAVGASKWLTLSHIQGETEAQNALDALKQRDMAFVAVQTNPDQAYTPETLPLNRPLALCFASERQGMSQATLANADMRLHLPYAGIGRHYNLSVCVALTLSQIVERLKQEQPEYLISPSEKQDLRLEWFIKGRKRCRDLFQIFLDKNGLDWDDLEGWQLPQAFLQLIRA